MKDTQPVPQAVTAAPQPAPPADTLSTTVCGTECPFGQFGAALPAVCVPRLPVRRAGQPSVRSWKDPWLRSNNWKHQYVINLIFIPNPKHSTTPATRKQINSVTAETRTVTNEVTSGMHTGWYHCYQNKVLIKYGVDDTVDTYRRIFIFLSLALFKFILKTFCPWWN